MAETTHDLLTAAYEGNTDALAALLREYGPAIRGQLSISPVYQAAVDAADVMQVTYLEAFLRIHQLEARTPEGFRAWLERLAHNNLRDAIRELERQKRPNRRQQVRNNGDSNLDVLDALDSGAESASRVVSLRESEQAIGAALEQLPALYAEVVRLHDLEGRSIADVAAALGRSTGAVYMLRARALERLRELLGPESAFFSRGA